MNPGDIVSVGSSIGSLSVSAVLGVAVVLLCIVVYKLWREGQADRKEAAATYIALLKEQFSDENRRKDLFDEWGKSVEALMVTVREQRQDFVAVRQELANIWAYLQRLKA